MPKALIHLSRLPAGRAGFRARPAWRLLPLAAFVLLSGCSSVNNYVPNFIKPYRPDIQQGNWITNEQVELLKPGMTREQVRFALGSPTLTSIFHSDRWDYPYLFVVGKSGETEERTFTVYFTDDRLARWVGDQQPSRQPFQAADTRKPMTATGTAAPNAATPNAAAPAPTPPSAAAPATSTDGTRPPAALDPSASPTATPKE